MEQLKILNPVFERKNGDKIPERVEQQIAHEEKRREKVEMRLKRKVFEESQNAEEDYW